MKQSPCIVLYSCVHSYHVYQCSLIPKAGEELKAQCEVGNCKDMHALTVLLSAVIIRMADSLGIYQTLLDTVTLKNYYSLFDKLGLIQYSNHSATDGGRTNWQCTICRLSAEPLCHPGPQTRTLILPSKRVAQHLQSEERAKELLIFSILKNRIWLLPFSL